MFDIKFFDILVIPQSAQNKSNQKPETRKSHPLESGTAGTS